MAHLKWCKFCKAQHKKRSAFLRCMRTHSKIYWVV